MQSGIRVRILVRIVHRHSCGVPIHQPIQQKPNNTLLPATQIHLLKWVLMDVKQPQVFVVLVRWFLDDCLPNGCWTKHPAAISCKGKGIGLESWLWQPFIWHSYPYGRTPSNLQWRISKCCIFCAPLDSLLMQPLPLEWKCNVLPTRPWCFVNKKNLLHQVGPTM